ncbi:S1/P1 Nuclease [Chryseobacterium nematophagum]|uniref:S1/P1 Nuclease n=1 Tax=Chryseobacterium nematophagum TaxID=2305228 RepID=A0A3M7THI7_9FLAO|nr:S1/P1 nuclease [Chryseobacterium nematophagum]RNA62456.1 S1/P1 Nuclease [Chryseobacterium nematophagum]
MKSTYSKILLLACMASSIYSYAWGLTGHRIIAEIAENHLSGKAKREIQKLMGKERLAYWANWPDFIKSDTTGTWKQASMWHYVNIDPQKDFNTFEQHLKAQAGPNLYTQVKTLSNQLKNKNTSEKDKKTALIFLIHIMGDLAQPLHTGRAEDLGGNKINVTYFGEKTNLHSVWDGKLLDSQKYSYTEYSKLLDIKSKDTVKQIQSGTFEEWLYDSHIIANTIYAQTPEGSKLSYDYQYKFNDTLERQLLYGGLRLAKMLNDLYVS